MSYTVKRITGLFMRLGKINRRRRLQPGHGQIIGADGASVRLGARSGVWVGFWMEWD